MLSELFQGHYLFHLHTRYTDGKLDAEDYFVHAKAHGIDRLIFLEHIRREPSYDVRAYIDEVRGCASRHELRTHIGFEAKLLPEGRLDISEKDLNTAEVVGIAEHGFPKELGGEDLKQSFFRTIDWCVNQRQLPFVWVHPGLWFRKKGLLGEKEQDYRQMIQFALDAGIGIERNFRYGLLPDSILPAVPETGLIIGVDAHTSLELESAAAKLNSLRQKVRK